MSSKYLVFALTLGGCYAAAADGSNGNGAPPTTQASVGDTGLPCNVQKVLADRCWTCHGTTPRDRAQTLVSYDDLSRKDSSGKTFAELAIERIHDEVKPMPPSGSVPDADKDVLDAWVRGGAKRGSCVDGADPRSVYDTPVVCTTGSKWTGGDHESPYMHPGVACIECHKKEREAPSLVIAGTIYPTGHEPDDCNGTVKQGALTVIITDASGREHKASVNKVGNFYLKTPTPVTMPYRAKIVAADGSERVMNDEQTTGDCNGCHTQDGNKDAPGRLIPP